MHSSHIHHFLISFLPAVWFLLVHPVLLPLFDLFTFCSHNRSTEARRWLRPSETPPHPVGWKTTSESGTSPRLRHRPSPSRCASCRRLRAVACRTARWPPCGAGPHLPSPGRPRPPAPPAEPETTSRTSCGAAWWWFPAGTRHLVTPVTTPGGGNLHKEAGYQWVETWDLGQIKDTKRPTTFSYWSWL